VQHEAVLVSSQAGGELPVWGLPLRNAPRARMDGDPTRL